MSRIKFRIKLYFSQKRLEAVGNRVAKQAGKGSLAPSMLKLLAKISVLAIGVIVVLFPFYFMLSNSLMTYNEVTDKTSIHWWPDHVQWSNFSKAFSDGYFSALWLTAVITFISIVLKILVTLLMGYAFSLNKWRGKKAMWAFMLMIMMLPEVALMSGQFTVITKLHWRSGTMLFAAMSLPFIASIFSALMFRNAFEAIPSSIKEAAMIDGASESRYFLKVAVPMITPTIWTVGILTAFAAWNSYMWPALLLQGGDPHQVMSTWLFTTGKDVNDPDARVQTQLRMAASILAILPMLIVYFGMRGRIMRAISRQGSTIKG